TVVVHTWYDSFISQPLPGKASKPIIFAHVTSSYCARGLRAKIFPENCLLSEKCLLPENCLLPDICLLRPRRFERVCVCMPFRKKVQRSGVLVCASKGGYRLGCRHVADSRPTDFRSPIWYLSGGGGIVASSLVQLGE
ncbi:unnamed protein product, partial [Ascophyllum nodosum]